jgi:ubiquinone/menaquinone biosynthesis C-methylase UbiE
MSMWLPKPGAWSFCVAASVSFACAAAAVDPVAPDRANDATLATSGPARTTHFEPVPTIEQRSAKPGINDPYFRADALERYIRILESETREVVQRSSDIIEAIGLEEGMIVADIGAGTGLLTLEMAKQVGPRGKVFAVDIVPAFLERIRERARAEGLDNVVVVQGKERETGLETASLDLAFMCDTYHHIEYPQAYLHSLFDVLRPGGTLVLVDMKRYQDRSSPAVLTHVRANKSTVIAELEQTGFILTSETDLLEENYYLHFRRP